MAFETGTFSLSNRLYSEGETGDIQVVAIGGWRGRLAHCGAAGAAGSPRELAWWLHCREGKMRGW
jgi:hypothetical protein